MFVHFFEIECIAIGGGESCANMGTAVGGRGGSVNEAAVDCFDPFSALADTGHGVSAPAATGPGCVSVIAGFP